MKRFPHAFLAFAAAACLSLTCSGCWDYRGLNQLTIVAGFALDEAPDGGYLLSLEIISASSDESDASATKLIQSEGETIADAVYNIGTQFYNNVYFGNTDVLILSRSLVEKNGLYNLVDPLLRDNGIRDNLVILISGEQTAYELLIPQENENTVISFDINNKILNSKKSVTVTRSKELYEIYGILSRQASDLALPVVRFNNPNEKKLVLDGLATFRGERLAGALREEQMQEYLLLVESLSGGGFVLREPGEASEESVITIAIRQSKPSLKYEYGGSGLTYTIEIEVVASAVEFNTEAFKIYRNTENDLQKLEKRLEESISASLENMISEYLEDCGGEKDPPDIFGFADAIYYKDPELWESVRDHWPELFRNARFDVSCRLIINDTGLIKRH